MYKSPVDIFEEISTKITEETDNHIIAEIEKAIGVSVDKDELIKALNYDRNQYNQGYNDAKERYAPKREEWIPVSERLPEKEMDCLVTDSLGKIHKATFYHTLDGRGTYFSGCYHRIIAWMPLPEPYKAESEGKNDNYKI